MPQEQSDPVIPPVKSKTELYYNRRSVGQSVLVPGSYPDLVTRFNFLYWQLRVWLCVLPSLTRGWICNLLVQLVKGLARAVTGGSESHRTQTIFYCLIWDSPNLGICPQHCCSCLYLGSDRLEITHCCHADIDLSARSTSPKVVTCLAVATITYPRPLSSNGCVT
jgi:hypothetical protein